MEHLVGAYLELRLKNQSKWLVMKCAPTRTAGTVSLAPGYYTSCRQFLWGLPKEIRPYQSKPIQFTIGSRVENAADQTPHREPRCHGDD